MEIKIQRCVNYNKIKLLENNNYLFTNKNCKLSYLVVFCFNNIVKINNVFFFLKKSRINLRVESEN